MRGTGKDLVWKLWTEGQARVRHTLVEESALSKQMIPSESLFIAPQEKFGQNPVTYI